MDLEEITGNVFHIHFETQEGLASTFLRFQEHFESPEFKGKIFSLAEYKKWYVANSKKGRETEEFTYYSDWNGFNIPSHVLEPFYNGDFDPLSEAEEGFLDLFVAKRGTLFYVIGTHGQEKPGEGALKHEVAHGLFFTNPEYRAEVLRLLGQIPLEERENFNEFLGNNCGYHSDVWEDETHAYIVNSLDYLKRKHNVDVSGLKPFEPKMGMIFEKYFRPKNN